MKRSVLLAVFLAVLSPSLFAAIGPFTTKVAFTSDRDGNFEIYTMLPTGASQTRLTNNTATDTHPSFSPDGTKIAFMSDRDGNEEIYIMNADGSAQEPVTHNPASDSQPTWSPDGRLIVFQSTRNGGFDIFAMNADGSGVTQLTNDPGFDLDPAFSPAGTKIAFTSSRDGNFEIYSMNPDGTSQTRLTNNTLFEGRADFSPDGTKIAFNRNVPSNGGFTKQVMIMNADGTNATVLTSAGANGNPVFSLDGSRIFFDSTRNLPTEIFSMAVDGSNQVRLTNNTFGDTAPSTQNLFEVETFGVYRPTTGKWVLHTANASQAIDINVNFGGQPGDLPVAGNWDGDTRTDIGVFHDGTFRRALLKKSFFGITVADEIFPVSFGLPGDLPVVGDWDGDGKDEVGIFRPGPTGKFFLRLPNGTSITFNFGTAGDLPVAGDWNGDGIDTVGIYRPDDGTFLLTNSFANVVDFQFTVGGPGDQPMAGDWFATGRDGVGLYVPSSSLMVLLPDLFSKPSFFFTFGQHGDLPVAGSWLP